MSKSWPLSTHDGCAALYECDRCHRPICQLCARGVHQSVCSECYGPDPESRIKALEAERDAAKSKLKALADAADAYCPADPSAWLDAEYDAFYDETGHWPNGRDRPAAMGGYDRAASHEAWCQWSKPRRERREKALRDAIAAAREMAT